MNKAIIQKHQTLLDIAVQHCGSADALFELALLNDLSMTDEVAPGTSLLLPDVVDVKAVKVLAAGNHKPVTGKLPEVQIEEGLEIWAIELDFIIS